MSSKFALIIGNTEYIDPGLAQLTAPSQDADDFARVLKDHEIGAFDNVNVLLNQPEPVVRGAIDEFFDQKKPDDLLVLYFSGHGVRDELGSLYLAVKNTMRSRLRSTAVKSDYIREAMDQSRSRRQVLILDCCNSGAFAQGTKAATGVSIGTATAFESGFGRIILTASDSTQFAWEGDRVIGETDNSLFTHYLVEGLKGDADNDGDGRITVDELYDYAYEKVRRATPKQTPSKFSSKQQGEIILRQNMRIEDIKPVALPHELLDEIEDTRPYVREAAVQKLEKILKGKNIGLAHSAREALEKIVTDENTTRRVAQAATEVLESVQQAEQLTIQKEAEEQKLDEEQEAKRVALRKKEVQRLSHERAVEVEHQEKGKAERFAEEQRRTDEQVEIERKAREESEQLAAAREIRAEPLAQQKEISNIINSPRWVSVLWITLGWGIGGLIGGAIGGLTEGNSVFFSQTNIVALTGAIGGACGGFMIGITLRKEQVIFERKNILWTSLGWTIVMATLLWVSFGQDRHVNLLTNLLVGGAVGGILTAMVLWMEHVLSDFEDVLWITLGWTISLVSGLWNYAGTRGISFKIYDAISSTIGDGHWTDVLYKAVPAISGGLGAALNLAIIGSIGGLVMIWRIRREISSPEGTERLAQARLEKATQESGNSRTAAKAEKLISTLLAFARSWQGRIILGGVLGVIFYIFDSILSEYWSVGTGISIVVVCALAGLITYPHRFSFVLLILGFLIAGIVSVIGEDPFLWGDIFVEAGAVSGLTLGAVVSRILNWLKLLK